jgi:hypothetical protein
LYINEPAVVLIFLVVIKSFKEYGIPNNKLFFSFSVIEKSFFERFSKTLL